MSKIDKTLNASLVTFNQHIVAIKSVVKKAKVNEVHKLIRKIKLLSKKKGSEIQLVKNKRKCEHLKNEINQIKSLKFNEIAIFSIENDGLSFNDYLKSNKDLNTEKISLARIGFNKLVLELVNKMKTDPKIDGWKRTFIQYKARAEKRRNWKEKNKQLKDIEEKLNLNKDDDDDDEKSESDEESEKKKDHKNVVEIEDIAETKTESVTKEEGLKPANSIKKTSKLEKKLTKTKISKERKVKFSDDETSSDESADLSDDDLSEYGNESNGEFTRQVKFSDEESSTETDDQFKDSEYQVEKFETKPKETVKSLKPLVFENKSSKMEIKQLNLEEMNDLSEIPISNKEAAMSDDEESFREENGDMNIVPISSDPFFLDKNGREVYNPRFDYNLRESDTRSSYKYNSRFNDRFNDNKETFRNKRDSLNSSFKTSLSSSRPIHSTSYSNRGRDFNDNRNRPFNNYNNNGNNHNRNMAFPISRESSFRSNFNERGSFNRTNISKQPEPLQDLSKLHPSWQAKKIMEDKLKSMKFEGKKVKFDD